jgi:hypothetical protein
MMVRYIIDTNAQTLDDLKDSTMMGINLTLHYQGNNLVLLVNVFKINTQNAVIILITAFCVIVNALHQQD